MAAKRFEIYAKMCDVVGYGVSQKFLGICGRMVLHSAGSRKVAYVNSVRGVYFRHLLCIHMLELLF